MLLSVALGAPPVAASPKTDDAVEAYLEARGLDLVLATHLEGQLVRATPEAKPEIAQRLGDVYIRLLEAAEPGAERRAIESRAKLLIAAVPDAETAELEISLAKASYLLAEATAERWRLRLASVAERQDAQRAFRSIIPQLRAIAQRAHRLVESVERRELAQADVGDEVRAKLTEARRVRSLAYYYLGWSRYYISMLSGDASEAMQAVEDFGWLLNAQPGQPADLARLPEDNLRFDHVARAALGVAMCYSLFGEDTRALRWLSAVEENEETPEAVHRGIFSRSVVIRAAHGRWDEVRAELAYELEQREDGLTLNEARLLAVLALESPDPDDRIVSRVTRTALEQMVDLGAADQILDLMERYGTADLPGDGFVPRFVRALRSFREASQSLGDDHSGGPVADSALAGAFDNAARAFESANDADDADEFPAELERCRVNMGAALIFAGKVERAVTVLASLAASDDPEIRERAAWLLITGLEAEGERQIEAGDSERGADLLAQRDRFAERYIATYPTSGRAVSLALGTPIARISSVDEAVRTLLSVRPESALYVPARERAADLLYRRFRSAAGSERQTAGMTFADIASELIVLDTQGARGDSHRALGRIRQSLDVLLGLRSPDTGAARRLITMAMGLSDADPSVSQSVRAELLLRRVQISLIEGEPVEATLDELKMIGGDEAEAALRLVFSDARAAFRSEQTEETARRVIDTGMALVDRLESDAVGAASIRDEVAGAASVLAVLLGEGRRASEARALAVRLDRAAMDRSESSRPQLRRLAMNSEADGDLETALRAWSTIMAGTDESVDDWFGARYESLRILAKTNPEAAHAAFAQHAALNPELGPEPWATRLRALGRSLGVE